MLFEMVLTSQQQKKKKSSQFVKYQDYLLKNWPQNFGPTEDETNNKLNKIE